MYESLYRLVLKEHSGVRMNALRTGRRAFDDRFALVDLNDAGLPVGVLGAVIDDLMSGPLQCDRREFTWRDQTRAFWCLAPRDYSWDPQAFYDAMYWPGDIDRLFEPGVSRNVISHFQQNSAWLLPSPDCPVVWTFDRMMRRHLERVFGQEVAA